MTNVLLIWEEIPETIKCFYIENATDEEINTLKTANGKYINASDDIESVEEINLWISDTGKWKDKELPTPVEKDINLVINCGFII